MISLAAIVNFLDNLEKNVYQFTIMSDNIHDYFIFQSFKKSFAFRSMHTTNKDANKPSKENDERR